MKKIANATVNASQTSYRQNIEAGTFALVADEPPAAGGQGAGPAPYDLLLASLGACTAITLQMYAERKGFELSNLRIELMLFKNREGETRIERVLHSTAELNDGQRERLLDIAGKTPVTKTLLNGVQITTNF